MDNPSSNPLPPLYARWFNELLGGELPAEPRATCHDCAMCDSTGATQPTNRQLYHPQVKCCTYWPRLPNFLAGMILLDEDPALTQGRDTVTARLRAGLAVTPLGLERPPKMDVLYTQIEPRAFGRALSLRCPHYVDEQGGLCGIWRYRNGVCSTWFCKHERGVRGRDLWERVNLLLLAIEEDLARWCALKLDVDDTALELLLTPRALAGQPPRLSPSDLESEVEPARQRSHWGQWLGREQEFYGACADLVARLTWPEVVAICGPETQARARLAQSAYRRLKSDGVPARLKIGSFTILEANADFYCLHHSGMGLDTFSLSAKVMRLLPYFDGRPTAETVNRIAEKEGLRFTTELLQRLVDFNILVAA